MTAGGPRGYTINEGINMRKLSKVLFLTEHVNSFTNPDVQYRNFAIIPALREIHFFREGGLAMRGARIIVPVRMITRTALLLALTVAVQALSLPPVITGPLVNFMLVVASLAVGAAGGVMIGALTPWIALAVGILPPPLAPAVPFIMAGNAVLCLLVGLFASRSNLFRFLGVAAGSVLKFVVIAWAASYVLTLPEPMVHTLMLPQLTNALLGGLPAVVIAAFLSHAVLQKAEQKG